MEAPAEDKLAVMAVFRTPYTAFPSLSQRPVFRKKVVQLRVPGIVVKVAKVARTERGAGRRVLGGEEALLLEGKATTLQASTFLKTFSQCLETVAKGGIPNGGMRTGAGLTANRNI